MSTPEISIKKKLDLDDFKKCVEDNLGNCKLVINKVYTMAPVRIEDMNGEGLENSFSIYGASDKLSVARMPAHDIVILSYTRNYVEGSKGATLHVDKIDVEVSDDTVVPPTTVAAETEATVVGAGRKYKVYNKKKYVVRTGKKGGQYILVDGKKIYV